MAAEKRTSFKEFQHYHLSKLFDFQFPSKTLDWLTSDHFYSYEYWPNISANDPYPGSGSKNLSLSWDHF